MGCTAIQPVGNGMMVMETCNCGNIMGHVQSTAQDVVDYKSGKQVDTRIDEGFGLPPMPAELVGVSCPKLVSIMSPIRINS